MNKLKFCPLLVGKEERKAIMVGHGDIVVPILYPCIKDKCIAYKDEECHFYHSSVTLDEHISRKEQEK